jgi:hypothetical protein
MKVGSTVRTQYKFYGRRRIGTIESIDGWYIYVRLNYKNILIEAYPVELTEV